MLPLFKASQGGIMYRPVSSSIVQLGQSSQLRLLGYTLGLELSKRGEMIIPILPRGNVKKGTEKFKIDIL